MRNFSATGGADSGPQSIAETPTEEKDTQFGNGKFRYIRRCSDSVLCNFVVVT